MKFVSLISHRGELWAMTEDGRIFKIREEPCRVTEMLRIDLCSDGFKITQTGSGSDRSSYAKQ